MKTLKRSLSMLLLFMGLFAIPVSANPLKYPVLVGEVVDVQDCNNKNGEMKVLVSGYLNGCEVYKGEVCVLVDKDTKITMGCEKEKDDCKDIKCKKGDFVSIALDKKMTKSNPPQSKAKRIKITRVEKEKNEKKDNTKANVDLEKSNESEKE